MESIVQMIKRLCPNGVEWKKIREREALARPDFRGFWASVTDKYKEKAHFVYEHLQNADDAQATEAVFRVEYKRLVFRHNGKVQFSVVSPTETKRLRAFHPFLFAMGQDGLCLLPAGARPGRTGPIEGGNALRRKKIGEDALKKRKFVWPCETERIHLP